jgi:hypothetical protein
MSSLLDELGLDPDEFEWTDLALCQGMPTNLFYEDYEQDSETAKATDEACLRCPVISQCFFRGSKNEHGVWGGVYWNGSGRPDKNKNAHKNDNVWQEIYDKVGTPSDD